MRPRSHQARSLAARKFAPSGATLMDEKPPNSLNLEVRTRPPRNSSWPNSRRPGSRWSKAAIGSDCISMAVGGDGGAAFFFCAAAGPANAARTTSAMAAQRQSSRVAMALAYLRPPGAGIEEASPRPATRCSGCGRTAPRAARWRRLLVEQLGQLLGHGAAELLGVDDGDGAAIVARHVVADADGDQLDRRAQSRSPRSPSADGARDSCRD